MRAYDRKALPRESYKGVEMKNLRMSILVLMLFCTLSIFMIIVFAQTAPGEITALSSTKSSEAILWFFLGTNGALVFLALAIRKNMPRKDTVREAFVVSRSFRIGSTLSGLPLILEWLVEQAHNGNLNINSVIQLYNSIEEVSAHTLRAGHALGIKENLKADIVIRKGIGSVNLTHTGPALSLVAYDPDDMTKGKGKELEGLELFMAKSQVDFLEYKATLSKDRHLFKIRKSLKNSHRGGQK